MKLLHDRFEVGQRLRIYDYCPVQNPEIADRAFFEGVYQERTSTPEPGMMILCDNCPSLNRKGKLLFVPFEQDSLEFMRRVELAPIQ